jgi:hypothetical protein
MVPHWYVETSCSRRTIEEHDGTNAWVFEIKCNNLKTFLDTDALPHVHCSWHYSRRSGCCHRRRRVVFSLHHVWNTSNHFNCSELSTSIDCSVFKGLMCVENEIVASYHAFQKQWIRDVEKESLPLACVTTPAGFPLPHPSPALCVFLCDVSLAPHL